MKENKKGLNSKKGKGIKDTKEVEVMPKVRGHSRKTSYGYTRVRPHIRRKRRKSFNWW